MSIEWRLENKSSTPLIFQVIVIERKTGNVLAGPNAPTTSNLKTWLQEHPTYEVVQPGTNIIKSSPNITKIKAKSNAPKFLSVLTMGQDKQQIFVSSALKSPTAGVKLAPKTVSPNLPSNLKSPTSLNRPQTPKTLVKSPPPVKVQTPQLKVSFKLSLIISFFVLFLSNCVFR